MFTITVTRDLLLIKLYRLNCQGYYLQRIFKKNTFPVWTFDLLHIIVFFMKFLHKEIIIAILKLVFAENEDIVDAGKQKYENDYDDGLHQSVNNKVKWKKNAN